VETLAGYPGEGADLVASVDAAGVVGVWRASGPDAGLVVRIPPTGLEPCETGWCGVTPIVAPGAAASGGGGDGGAVTAAPLLVARYAGRDLSLVDVAAPGGPVVSWTTSTLGKGPAAIEYIPSRGAVAVLEHNELCLWDLRAGDVVARAAFGLSQLLCCARGDAADGDESNELLFSGADKVLRIYDLRASRLRREAPGVSKHETVKIAPAADGVVFVAGLDNEVMCSNYRTGGKQKAHSGFMGDARWVGLCASGDGRLTALTTSGKAYVFTCAALMGRQR
jgi:hypothetical protein